MTVMKYFNVIIDKKMFDFWLESIKKVLYSLKIRDNIPYHKGIASQRGTQFEKNS